MTNSKQRTYKFISFVKFMTTYGKRVCVCALNDILKDVI